MFTSQYFPGIPSISQEAPVFHAVLGNMSISHFFANFDKYSFYSSSIRLWNCLPAKLTTVDSPKAATGTCDQGKLIGLRGCTGWSESLLVAQSYSRFCHVLANFSNFSMKTCTMVLIRSTSSRPENWKSMGPCRKTILLFLHEKFVYLLKCLTVAGWITIRQKSVDPNCTNPLGVQWHLSTKATLL